MGETTIRDRVLEEIRRIPTSQLGELYEVVRYFRMGIEASRSEEKNVMRFAGAWADMPDDLFQQFLVDIAERRRNAFSRRRGSESDAN